MRDIPYRMDFITSMESPISIREKLASQISTSPSPSPVEDEVKKNDDSVNETSPNVEENVLEPLPSIDDSVNIDPSLILEDETSRNTRYNSMLYDQDSDDELQKPVPIHLSHILSPTQSPLQTPQSPLGSLPHSPIASPIKSLLSVKSPSTPTRQLLYNSNYEKMIMFDTLNNKNANNLSMFLKTKHLNYKFTRISRTFLCGYDDHKYSETALKWLIDEIIHDNDELICLKVLSNENYQLSHNYQLENEKLMQKIIELNKSNKKISILLEICIATKVSKKIMNSIKDYEPSLLVVGTSGVQKKGFMNIISPKSMSKYCLQYSEVPVIVVKPTYKPLRRKRSCITIKKIPVKPMEQSLDNLVLSDQDDDEYEEVIKVDKSFYKNLICDFIPSDQQQQREERLTRSTRPKSTILTRLLTPVDSTRSLSHELLLPTRSRGVSPLRSLSPFWKRNK